MKKKKKKKKKIKACSCPFPAMALHATYKKFDIYFTKDIIWKTDSASYERVALAIVLNNCADLYFLVLSQ